MPTEDEQIWEALVNDPPICLLKRLYFHSVECLREVAGDKFDVLIKPIYYPSAISANLQAKKVLQLDGDDLISNARIVSFLHDYFVYGGQGLCLYEKAIVKKADHCLIQDGPVDACIHCRLGGPYVCKSNNSKQVMIVTSSLNSGYKNCEWHIKNVDQVINIQKDYGKKVRDLPKNPLDIDQRRQLAREALTYYLSFMLMAIADNYGIEELLTRMRYRMITEGMIYYSTIDKKLKKEHEDNLRQAFIETFNVLAIRSEIDLEERSTQITISDCPFSSFPPFVCQIVELFFSGFCKGHAGGKELVQIERMTEGASHCRYIIRDISPSDRKWSD